jgi:hypothetical protein
MPNNYSISKLLRKTINTEVCRIGLQSASANTKLAELACLGMIPARAALQYWLGSESMVSRNTH